MVILIPLIIIFLSLAYLEIADNITLVDKTVVTIIIITTLYSSFKLYKKVKQNLKQQEINKILLEIKESKEKLQKAQDKKEEDYLNLKIEKLKKELDTI